MIGASPTSSSPHTVFELFLPLPEFLESIKEPLPSYIEWQKKSWESLLIKTENSNFTNSEIQTITSKMYNELLNFSGIFERIKAAYKLLKDVEEHRFLKGFSKQSAPLKFWNKYKSLSKKAPEKCALLDHIIGEQGLKILRECSKGGGQVMQMKIQSQTKTIAVVEKRRLNFTNSSIKFDKKFDFDNLNIVPDPIFILSHKEFEDGFSPYYLDGPFAENAIRINGEAFVIPDYKSLNISKENRKSYFQEKLVSKIQEKLGLTSTISVQDQLKLFSGKEGFELKCNLQKLKMLIINAFTAEFSEQKISDAFAFKISECFLKLQGDKEGKDFAKHMLPFNAFVGRYLACRKGYAENDWDTVADLLIDLYQRLYLLQEKLDKIPLLPLLKGMSPPCYLPCKTFLKTTLCPNLFKGEGFPYQIVLNDEDPGVYDLIGQGKSFEVMHVKAFQVVSGGQNKVTGKMCWTIYGQLGSIEYSSTLQVGIFDFSPQCLPDERERIMGLFNLKCQNCPWGRYVNMQREQLLFPTFSPRHSSFL